VGKGGDRPRANKSLACARGQRLCASPSHPARPRPPPPRPLSRAGGPGALDPGASCGAVAGQGGPRVGGCGRPRANVLFGGQRSASEGFRCRRARRRAGAPARLSRLCDGVTRGRWRLRRGSGACACGRRGGRFLCPPSNPPSSSSSRPSSLPAQVKRSTPMKKVFEAFAKHKNAGANTFKFLFDGVRINDTETADTVRCACGGGGGGGTALGSSRVCRPAAPLVSSVHEAHTLSLPSPPSSSAARHGGRGADRRPAGAGGGGQGGEQGGGAGAGAGGGAQGRQRQLPDGIKRKCGGEEGAVGGFVDRWTPPHPFCFRTTIPRAPLPNRPRRRDTHSSSLRAFNRHAHAHHHARFARPSSAPTESPSRSLSVPPSARRRRR
jgi:hypothetical protein